MIRRLSLCAVCALGIPACTSKGDDSAAPPAADLDGDGLDAAFEAEVGTTDESGDTDGDGCSDTVEVLGYFDPLDPTDRPYAGGYPRGPRADAGALQALAAQQGEAFEEGSLNPNWTLTDQHGEVVELRDFYGQVVVVDLGSEWCVPCQESVPVWNELYQQRREEGFVVLQILLEGVENNSEPSAERWAEGLGASFPVLADYSPGDYTVTEVAQYYLDVEGPGYDLPNYTILDRQHVIRELYSLNAIPGLDSFDALLADPAPATDARLPEDAEALREALGFTPGSWVTPASLCEG